MNIVCLMGRLVATPELKYTQSGTAVCTIRLAVDSGYVDQTGQRKSDFFNVVCWKGTAEFVSKYFAKGQMMAVNGTLRTRSWEDKYEQKRTEVEVVATGVHFTGDKAERGYMQEPAAVQTYGFGGFTTPPPRPISGPTGADRADSYDAEQSRFDFRNDFRPMEEDEDVPF